MYCPGCATQNQDDAKFCRVCGTNLANVAMALSNKGTHPSTGDLKAALASNPHYYRRHGMKKLIEGSGLITASALVGTVLAIFSGKPDWLMIWLVFAAWLAVFGVLSIAKGIGSLLEWKYLLAQLEKTGVAELETPVTDKFKELKAPVTSPKLTPIPSVTEHTTKLLDDKIPDGN